MKTYLCFETESKLQIHCVNKSELKDRLKTLKIDNYIELTKKEVEGLKYLPEFYTIKNGKLVESVERALDNKLIQIREKRNSILKELDILSLRCLEENKQSELEKIKKKKEQLRNIPNTIKSKGFNSLKEIYSFDWDSLYE